MIARLEGKLAEKNPEGLILDVGGVGFYVLVSAMTFSKLPREGESCLLHVHTNMHERGIDLFGFHDQLERRVFRMLIGIPGIGPRVALGILSAVEVPALMDAVRGEDLNRLTMIPGVGRKTAQRLVVELQGKLKKFSVAGTEQRSAGEGVDGVKDSAGRVYADVHSALCNMGYKASHVDKIIKELRDGQDGENLKLEDALMAGLKLLHRAVERKSDGSIRSMNNGEKPAR